jgi:uncharacterized protein with HEPN domain
MVKGPNSPMNAAPLRNITLVMPKESSAKAMRTIVDNVVLAQEFVASFSASEFYADRRTLFAVSFCLGIIAGAARRLGPLYELRHPKLPWEAIRAAGNLQRIGLTLAEPFVWETANSLRSLLDAVRADLERDALLTFPDV